MRRFVVALLLVAGACRGRGDRRERGRDLVLSRVMVDPATVADDRGEWIEITNVGSDVANLRDWSLRSGNDAGFEIDKSVTVPPGTSVFVARNSRAHPGPGARVSVVYSGITLGNTGDWLVLRAPEGATRDSLAWISPPRGVPIMRPPPARAGVPSALVDGGQAGPTTDRELVVRVLDVGQGDAILIQNGGSTVLVDGGPDRRVLGRWLDQLGVRDTIDAVILTHEHSDHYEGLRELFSSRRKLAIRFFWSNGDPVPNLNFTHLPDSIEARARNGVMTYRDTDDPCADGSAICTFEFHGGAKLHLMRPMPNGVGQNNRSVALKLIGPDSASFTMWMAGDAERDEIGWYDRTADYARMPGMRADVLKADHHGGCDGVTDRYLDLVHPSVVVASLAAVNDYGHMHAQAALAFARHGVSWYRTDQNGAITLRSPGTPGGGYTVHVERGSANASGPSDRRSREQDCARM
ncbi:MAG: lamin tail domain-containing protein [bacterium]